MRKPGGNRIQLAPRASNSRSFADARGRGGRGTHDADICIGDLGMLTVPHRVFIADHHVALGMCGSWARSAASNEALA